MLMLALIAGQQAICVVVVLCVALCTLGDVPPASRESLVAFYDTG